MRVKQRLEIQDFNNHQNGLIRGFFEEPHKKVQRERPDLHDMKKFITTAQIIYHSIEDEDQRESVLDEMITNFVEQRVLAPESRPKAFKDADATQKLKDFLYNSIYESVTSAADPEAPTRLYKDMAYLKVYEKFKDRVAEHNRLSVNGTFKREMTQAVRSYSLGSVENIELRRKLRSAYNLEYRSDEITKVLDDDFLKYATSDNSKKAIRQTTKKLDSEFQSELGKNAEVSGSTLLKEFIVLPAIMASLVFAGKCLAENTGLTELKEDQHTTEFCVGMSFMALSALKNMHFGVPKVLNKRVNYGKLIQEREESLQSGIRFRTRFIKSTSITAERPVVIFSSAVSEDEYEEKSSTPPSEDVETIRRRVKPKTRGTPGNTEDKAQPDSPPVSTALSSTSRQSGIGFRIDNNSFNQVIGTCVPEEAQLPDRFKAALEKENIVKIPNGTNVYELKIGSQPQRILCYMAKGTIYADCYSSKGLHRGASKNQAEINRLDAIARQKEQVSQSLEL